MENTAILNTGKLLYIRQYYITSNLPITHLAYVALVSLAIIFSMAWYKIAMQCSLVVHTCLKALVYTKKIQVMGEIFYGIHEPLKSIA